MFKYLSNRFDIRKMIASDWGKKLEMKKNTQVKTKA